MAAGCCCCCCVNFSPFFLVVVVVVSRERERDEIRYGLGMSPVHSNALGSVQALVCHATQHTPKVSGEISTRTRKIKRKKRKLCLASVIDTTTDTSQWKGRGQQQQQLRGSLTTLSARHTNGQTIDVPARRRYAMAAGQAGGRTGARASEAHSSVDSKRMIMGWKRGACHSSAYDLKSFSYFYSWASATFTCTQHIIPGVVYVARSLCWRRWTSRQDVSPDDDDDDGGGGCQYSSIIFDE